jgi:hypothetical protein
MNGGPAWLESRLKPAGRAGTVRGRQSDWLGLGHTGRPLRSGLPSALRQAAIPLLLGVTLTRGLGERVEQGLGFGESENKEQDL